MGSVNEFSKFIRDLANSLHTTKILYLGCYDVEDLSEFADSMNVSGISLSPETLEKIIEKYPQFKFKQANPINTPYLENEFDFVFAHKLFNFLNEEDTKKTVEEMYRISSKYIVNFELFSEKEQEFPVENGHFCGMYSKWLNYKVKIISNVQMHEEIDPERSQFTLVRKIS